MLFKFSRDKTVATGRDKDKIIKTKFTDGQTNNELLDDDDDDFIDLDNMNWFKWTYHVVTMPPSDLMILFHEKLALIDWDAKAKTVAQPLGHILTFTTFLIRFLQDNLIKPNYLNIYDEYRFETMFDFTKSKTLKQYNLFPSGENHLQNDNKKSQNHFYIRMKNYNTNSNLFYTVLRYTDYLFNIALLAIIITNLFITYRFIFGHYKKYSLFYTLKVSHETPDIVRKPLDILNEDNDEILSHGSLFTMIKHFIFKRNSNKTDYATDAKTLNEKDYYFEMKKWIPSAFITHLFMTFSPICLMFLLFSSVSFSTGIVIVIHQVIFQVILTKYHHRIVDDNILFSATLEEYYMKAIKPIVTKRYQDVKIDATTQGRGFVEFYPSTTSKQNNIFTSHFLNGDILREKYNQSRQEFEEVEEGNNGHNVIVREPYQLQQVYWDPISRQYIRVNRNNHSRPISDNIPNPNDNIHTGPLPNNKLDYKIMTPGAFSSGVSTPSVVSIPLNKATPLGNQNHEGPTDEYNKMASQHSSVLNNSENMSSNVQPAISLKRESISPLRQTVIYNNAESRTDPSSPSTKENSPL